MKKITKLALILFFICSANVLLAQNNEKIFEIKERRHPYSAVMDTASCVHQKGDVAIDRIYMAGDTSHLAYSINVLISCKDRLLPYRMNFNKKDEFDKFSYKWTADILLITFINSKTNLRKKLLLVQIQNEELMQEADEIGTAHSPNNKKKQPDCSLGFIKQTSDSFFDEYNFWQ